MESLVFMMAFVILAAYCIDFFSIVHTGIVNSSAARTYLFETLQHRTNIVWFRQGFEGSDSAYNFQSEHARFHGVSDEDQPPTDDNGAHTPGRKLTQAEEQNNMSDPTLDSQKNQTSTVQIRTGYGICLDAQCPVGGP